MALYHYSGPFSGVTLAPAATPGSKKGKPREVLLHPNKPVELPADHPYTRTMLAQGLLRPAEGKSVKGAADTSTAATSATSTSATSTSATSAGSRKQTASRKTPASQPTEAPGTNEETSQ